MWFREVDFPETLIEAHRTGSLVIFIGAGASRDAPSSLPDFRGLTAGIAADAQERPSDRDLEQPDMFLGELADRQVGVHRMVAARLGGPSSAPNRLHAAIVDLAAAGPPLRIVTTNYDLHLSRVLEDRGIEAPEFTGPALPVGDDFEGLVYLHGNLRQDPRHLVVTDRDFGRAYLRDAWAARFLERMFAAYLVLFIGYSHGDVVMRYLARGLRGGDGRYVLTPKPEAADWRRLDLHPIGYQVAEGSHHELVEALEGWTSQASMGLLDHRQRVAELVSAPPSQKPEEASYLEALIAHPDRVKLFVEFARGREWLTWAAQQPEFQRLFDPDAAPTACTRALAYWFAEHFVMVEELSADALGVVQEAGTRLGLPLWSAIGHHLHMRAEARPDWLSSWIVLLVENAPSGGQDWLEQALLASRWPEDREAVLLLFDHLTEPQTTWRPSLGLSTPAHCSVRARGDTHWLKEAWTKLLLPNLTDAAPALLAIADRHLRRGRQLLVTAGSAGPGFDPMAFHRLAIESHPQDDHRDVIDVLINTARDSLEVLLDRGDGRGHAYLEAWADCDVPIFRRLAVHGWAYRTDVEADAKIEWVRARRWLFDYQLRHEIFRLVAVALPDCDTEVADRLVADAAAGPQGDEDHEHRAYQRFNALVWILEQTPALASAQEALAQIQEEHPSFAERTHPDLTRWVETGWVRPQPPMTADELHERIAADATAAVGELRSYEGSITLGEPTWQDALAVLADAIKSNPRDGLAVLDADGGDHSDLAGAAIRGWTAANVDAETAEQVLECLEGLDLRPIAEDVARMLAEGGRSKSTPTEWHRFPVARRFASALWGTLDRGVLPQSADDWLGRAINHPAGLLAEFWVRAVGADWRAAGDDWPGLPPAMRAQLEALLDGEDDCVAMAEVVFASTTHFFFGADQEWCQAHVLPLLDWDNPERAQRTWDGFLTWGRWNDQMLSAGLLGHYLAAAGRICQLSEQSRQQLCRHLARVALTSELEPLDWLNRFTATVNADVRAEWMRQVAAMLGQLPVEVTEHQWQRWMRSYWDGRLRSIPRELTHLEASAMARWVINLSGSLEEAIERATAHPAGLGERADLLRHLGDPRLDQAPTAFARLLEHLLKGTATPFWDCHQLAKVVRRLRDQPAQVHVRSIVEQALRLGCHGAAEW